MTKRIWQFFLVFPVLFLLKTPVFADSQARVVRLSSVEGTVQVDRDSGQGFDASNRSAVGDNLLNSILMVCAYIRESYWL